MAGVVRSRREPSANRPAAARPPGLAQGVFVSVNVPV